MFYHRFDIFRGIRGVDWTFQDQFLIIKHCSLYYVLFLHDAIVVSPDFF